MVDLDRLVTEQPLRERFVDLLMRALYLAGRQAEALRAFQRFRDYLAEETGLPPSDALVDLEQRITVGDPSLAPMATEAVPGYDLAEVIGEGAFGSVYRAVQPSVGREVAVKVIRPELADDPRFVQRFEAEAQLVARIEHPHVVPLYDYWRRPGGAFLVFRLLRGGSLAEREAEGAVDLDAVSRLVDEVGGALAAAHALGVVHRDVKPANILFDEAGNSYLADFGIAERDDVDEDLDLRSAGSPLYASPEQIRDATASPASDQYAFAVVAWEALSGRAPFGGSSVTELGRVKFVDPVPPLDAGVDGAEAVGPVLAKATAPHPADRFGSVVEFVAAWRAAVAGPDLVRTTGETGAPAVGRSVVETLASLGVAGVNPYKGLRSFQEADAGEFCGRAELVTHLVERVAAEPFVTVVGPSGSGKSSLVHAGVVPEFRRRGALVVSMVPGSDPLVELEAALRRVATVEDEATIGARLRTPGGLVAAARDLLAPGVQLVLVVDQFEELWTLVPDVDARDRFADLLAHAAGPQDLLRVVATLRADQYDLPLHHPTLGPVVSASTFAVTSMTAAELQDAIVVPAERVGVRFEAGLVSTMVGDVVSRPGALPLLQFALTELFERRQNATVTTEAYEDLGGIGGALARRAEDLYEATAVEQRVDVHRLFTELVTPGDDSDDLRRRATVEELADIAPRVIEEYRSNRLIVTDHHPVTREPTVEVAHEALLREWPRLAGWIDGDRDTIRVRRSLTVAAHEWQADPADESTLYRGTRLVAADQVAQTLTLTGGERDFLAASHELADRERVARERANRRLRLLLVAALITLVLASATGVVALRQRDRASDQAARAEAASVSAEVDRIVAEVPRLLDRDRSLAALLAAEAVRLRPTPAARGALLSTLTDEPRLRFTLNGGRSGYFRATGFPDGRRVAALSRDGVDVWDIEARRLLGRFDVEGASAIAVSARWRPHRRRPGRRDGHVLGRRTVRAGGRFRRFRRAGHGVVVLARRPDPRGVDRQDRGHGGGHDPDHAATGRRGHPSPDRHEPRGPSDHRQRHRLQPRRSDDRHRRQRRADRAARRRHGSGVGVPDPAVRRRELPRLLARRPPGRGGLRRHRTGRPRRRGVRRGHPPPGRCRCHRQPWVHDRGVHRGRLTAPGVVGAQSPGVGRLDLGGGGRADTDPARPGPGHLAPGPPDPGERHRRHHHLVGPRRAAAGVAARPWCTERRWPLQPGRRDPGHGRQRRPGLPLPRRRPHAPGDPLGGWSGGAAPPRSAPPRWPSAPMATPWPSATAVAASGCSTPSPSGRSVPRSRSTRSRSSALGFSPDGRLLVATSNVTPANGAHVVDVATRSVQALEPAVPFALGAHVHPRRLPAGPLQLDRRPASLPVPRLGRRGRRREPDRRPPEEQLPRRPTHPTDPGSRSARRTGPSSSSTPRPSSRSRRRSPYRPPMIVAIAFSADGSLASVMDLDFSQPPRRRARRGPAGRADLGQRRRLRLFRLRA